MNPWQWPSGPGCVEQHAPGGCCWERADVLNRKVVFNGFMCTMSKLHIGGYIEACMYIYIYVYLYIYIYIYGGAYDKGYSGGY